MLSELADILENTWGVFQVNIYIKIVLFLFYYVQYRQMYQLTGKIYRHFSN